MFSDKPGCIKLADEIYLFKGYIPKDMVDKFVSLLETIDPKEFWEDDDFIEWYYDKMSPSIPEFFDIWEKVSDLIYPEYIINPQDKVIASRPGQAGMFVHCDSPGMENRDMLTQEDGYGTCSLISYGLVAYLGDFEGGEVFYPAFDESGKLLDEYDPSPEGKLSYKPEPGDVIIHHAEAPYFHGTKPVLSGTRYAYSLFATEIGMSPGTFLHYNTPEYLEAIKDRSKESLERWLNG